MSRKKFKISDNYGPGVTSFILKTSIKNNVHWQLLLKKMIEIGPIVIRKLRAQKGWGNKSCMVNKRCMHTSASPSI